MNISYGKDPKLRKKLLHTPITAEYTPEDHEQLRIKCSEHFEIEAKGYQLDFASRKLKNALDGFIPSQRKAFAGGRKMANSGNKKVKVYQMTGKVTTDFHYQHGDTSMNDTIIKMPISNGFGDRRNGRDETGSPRYIDTKLNKKLADAMFPPEDDWLLDYVFEDGEQAEPVNYIPVLPIAILETTTTVSVGWNIECWGRDPFEVIDNVRRLIRFNYPDPDSNVSPRSLLGKVWVPKGMAVDVCYFSNNVKAPTEVCFGEYEYDPKKNEVRVTQMPLKKWSYDYKCMLEGITSDAAGKPSRNGPKEYVKSVYDDTGNDKSDVIIKLIPGAYEKIQAEYGSDDGTLDPLEDYLEIRKQMHCRLNMLTDEGYVREFSTYESVIEFWYPKRRELYEQRITRQSLLLKFRIDYWENVLRFILADANKTVNIDKDFTTEQREEILTTANFTKFNKTTLFQPRYLKSEMLREAIYTIGASYKYIDQITVGEKSQKNIAALEKRIQDLKNELDELNRVTWKDLWMREIDALEEIIHEGIATKWLFGTKQHVFKKAEMRKKPTKK
jgi:DNA topoisomerase-2